MGRARAATEHPTITIANYNVDVAVFQVKIGEGALYPTVQLQGSLNKSFGSTTNLSTLQNFSAQIGGQLSVPLYQGGQEYATIRQAKETLGQRRLDLETARDQVQSNVTQAWGQLVAAKAQIESTTAQVNAAEIALNGVREEARVGQRTTLDVLNAQQDLVNARVALVTTAAHRMRAYRKRRRQGLQFIRIELHVTDIDSLIRVGFLKEEQRQNPEAVQAAVTGLMYRALEDAT